MEKLVRLYKSDPNPNNKAIEMYADVTKCDSGELKQWFRFFKDSKIDPILFISEKPIGLGWTTKEKFLEQLKNMECIFEDELDLDECEDSILSRVEANLSMKKLLEEQICAEKKKGKKSADEILSDPGSPVKSGGIMAGGKVSENVKEFYQELFDKCPVKGLTRKKTKRRKKKRTKKGLKRTKKRRKKRTKKGLKRTKKKRR